MDQKNLEKNLAYVLSRKDDLLKTYLDKYLVVFKEEIAGSFDTYAKAAEEAIRMFGIDADFIVYHVVKEDPVNFVMRALL